VKMLGSAFIVCCALVLVLQRLSRREAACAEQQT